MNALSLYTYAGTGWVFEGGLVVEPAALGGGLYSDARLVTGVIPARLGQLMSLLVVDGQTSTGQRKLHQENQEQDYHVLKEAKEPSSVLLRETNLDLDGEKICDMT